MNVYTMSKEDVCQVILRVAEKHALSIKQIGIGVNGSYFIIIDASEENKIRLCNYLTELNEIFLGTISEEGEVLNTEANILATGYSGPIILGCNEQEEFERYMLVAMHAGAEVVYKGGVMLGRD